MITSKGLGGLITSLLDGSGPEMLQRATFVPAEGNPAFADQLDEFNRLKGEGVGDRSVWEQTGIYAGAATGNTPVAEITDDSADFLDGLPPVTGVDNNEYNPLGKAFNHPELFDQDPSQYPLADINLETTDQTPASTRKGYYHPGNLREAEKIFLSLGEETPDSTSARSVLLHELQHAVQERHEHMPGGASPSSLNELGVGQYLADNSPDFMELVPEDRRLTEEQLEYIDSNPEFTVNDVYAYLFNDGEALARATQNRRDLTDEERRAKFPEDSLDVPSEALILYQEAVSALKKQ
tara:strand:+ start:134 stop:1018 length:885 start_codon:yes stop_codon:yes gene_type:complete